MITGSCLCGGVRFEIAEAVGPFELCHCGRCRKASGSAFTAIFGVRTRDRRFVQGRDLMATYEAGVPPPYRTSFCRRCGSPMPNPEPGAAWFEIPVGLSKATPGSARTNTSSWSGMPLHETTDSLPQFDKTRLRRCGLPPPAHEGPTVRDHISRRPAPRSRRLHTS
jgi:hypothetical protein